MLVEDALYEALYTISPNFNYIFENGNGSEPKPPYVIISKLPDINQGVTQRSFVDKSNREIIIKNKNVGFRVTLHAKNTDPQQDEFEWFNAVMESDLAVAAFIQNGLGLSSVGDISYIPTPVDTTMYQRQSFDLRFNIQYITEMFAHHVKTVSVDGCVYEQKLEDGGEWLLDTDGNFEWDNNSDITLEAYQGYNFKIDVKES